MRRRQAQLYSDCLNFEFKSEKFLKFLKTFISDGHLLIRHYNYFKSKSLRLKSSGDKTDLSGKNRLILTQVL